MEAAHAAGIPVSIDFNHRKQLGWWAARHFALPLPPFFSPPSRRAVKPRFLAPPRIYVLSFLAQCQLHLGAGFRCCGWGSRAVACLPMAAHRLVCRYLQAPLKTSGLSSTPSLAACRYRSGTARALTHSPVAVASCPKLPAHPTVPHPRHSRIRTAVNITLTAADA